jgi:hypothetical protein
MLPDKLSSKKTVVPDNYLFVPDNVRDRPFIFKLGFDPGYYHARGENSHQNLNQLAVQTSKSMRMHESR